MDTLAVQLTLPTTKRVVDFHHQVVAHAGRTKKRHPRLMLGVSLVENRQRPTLPGSYPPSTIGAEGLNFCVRDGYR